MNRVVFMDRDGTIIKEKPYISKPKDVELLPTSVSAIKLLRTKGFKVIVVTNQSGIGRGYFSLQSLYAVNRHFFNLLKANRTKVDKLYFCPHRPEDNCECRKPKPGMIYEAKKEFDIELKHSYIIGDTSKDIQLGKRVGLQTILVLTGYGKDVYKLINPDFVANNLPETNETLAEYGEKLLTPVYPDFVAKDLLEAANWICKK